MIHSLPLYNNIIKIKVGNKHLSEHCCNQFMKKKTMTKFKSFDQKNPQLSQLLFIILLAKKVIALINVCTC